MIFFCDMFTYVLHLFQSSNADNNYLIVKYVYNNNRNELLSEPNVK